MLQKHEQTFIALNPMAISIDILPMSKIVFDAFANGRGIGSLCTQRRRPGIGPLTYHRSFLCLISILRTKRFPATSGWNQKLCQIILLVVKFAQFSKTEETKQIHNAIERKKPAEI